ncbi:MAG: rhomboid family intramembrane serine protease [Planctomycetaceae bacterium]
MGLAERDYCRTYRSGWGSGPTGWPPTCRSIVFLCIGIFIAQLLIVRRAPIEWPVQKWGEDEESFVETWTEANGTASPDITESSREELRQEARRLYEQALLESAYGYRPVSSVVQQWCELDANKVMRGQIWRLLTCAFCHDRHSIFHILFNMLGLIWFGIVLEQMYGSREFLWFYLAAAVVSSLTYVALDLYTGESVPAIGASGAVMAVLMLYAGHFPSATICVWWLFPIQVRWLVLLYVAYDLHPVLLELSGEPSYSGVAHAAHLGGLAFGYVYWKKRLRLLPLVEKIGRIRWRKFMRRNPGLRLYASPECESELRDDPSLANEHRVSEALDRLLEKISREGRDSLTDEDLSVLEEESKRLRGHRSQDS